MIQILPFLLRQLAITYRMLRTMVITSLTHGTTTAPLRTPFYHTDVFQRTTLGTKSTTDTFFRRIKFFRPNHEAVEHRAYHIRLQPRHTSFMTIEPLCTPGNPTTDILHPTGSQFQFTSRQFRFVHIKTRHTDIRVGHRYRKASLTTPASSSCSPREYLCRLSSIIVTGTDKIQVIRRSLPFQLGQCFQYHRRRSPRINRKHKPQPAI